MIKSPSKVFSTKRVLNDINAEGLTIPLFVGDLKNVNIEPRGSGFSQGGELYVTIVSALMLFAHFGITLYKIESNNPDTPIEMKHLKKSWVLVFSCIIVHALASYLYRNALQTLRIKYALAILVPDMVTAGVSLLMLTKHVFYALCLLTAGITFLSVAVTVLDVYAYFNPPNNACTSDQISRKFKIDYDAMDESVRSITSSLSVSSLSVQSRTSSGISALETRRSINARGNSESLAYSWESGFRSLTSIVSPSSTRKKATRSVLRHPPKNSI